MNLPKALQNLIDDFQRLPGIGPKTAQRLAFYVLRLPKEQVNRFAEDLLNVKSKIIYCSNCFNVSDGEFCEICNNINRDKSTVCVVESVLDIIAIERSGFKGLYHVLHGNINPLAGIGPDEIFLRQLISRVDDEKNNILEVILATSMSLEGEATAMYINREIKMNTKIKVSRIGKGLPTGADLEYADESTLLDALKGRLEYK